MFHTAVHLAGPIVIIVMVIAYVVRSRAIARRVGKLEQALDSLGESSQQRADAEKTATKATEERLRDLAEKMNEADNHWRMAEERLKKKTAELELMAKSIADQVDRATRLPEKILAAVELVGRVFRQSFEAEERGPGQASPTQKAASADSPERSDSPPSPPPRPAAS